MADDNALSALLEHYYGNPDPRAAYRNPVLELGDRSIDAATAEPSSEPSWHDKYIKPWGSASLAQQEPNWFGKHVLGNVGKVSESLPPGIGDAILAGIMGPRAPVRIPNPLKAYHGSPHDFDKFDLAKIGTGEGAQAYGHGLYFAENEGVAKNYKGAGQNVNYKDPTSIAQYWVNNFRGDAAKTADHLTNLASTFHSDQFKKPIRDAAEMARSGAVQPSSPGRMYEVALHATPEQFLDWDKPLSGQGDAVRAAIAAHNEKKLAGYTGEDIPGWGRGQPAIVGHGFQIISKDGRLPKIYDTLEAAVAAGESVGSTGIVKVDPPGSRVYGSLSGLHDTDSGLFGSRGNQDKATAALAEAGIPGIKYLDQGSRGKGEGTSNFVVWSPEIIEMLRKYGIAAPVAGASLADILSQPSPKSP